MKARRVIAATRGLHGSVIAGAQHAAAKGVAPW
jgi:hypothetical protein